jgi:hypothetical protein
MNLVGKETPFLLGQCQAWVTSVSYRAFDFAWKKKHQDSPKILKHSREQEGTKYLGSLVKSRKDLKKVLRLG